VASRRAGLGGGSIIGGRVTLAMYPGALSALAQGRTVTLVSGTNGKTTTSHMLAAALRTAGAVAHNASGSNMADGAVAALAECPEARTAVLEVDELHLAAVAARCAPASIMLLNLSRDQLDRVAEVRQTAMAIGAALAGLPGTTVFANADDPMAVWAARQAAGPLVWVTAGSGWRNDCPSCPGCGRSLRSRESGWACDCGLQQPRATWWSEGSTIHGPDGSVELRVRLPGRVNRANALAAVAVASAAGIERERAGQAAAGLQEIAGRYAVIRHCGRTVRLLLAKNPAGWAATLDMIGQDRPVLILINAREADGRDTSWLWDLDCTPLRGRVVVAGGERAADLGVRLSYAEVTHLTECDPLTALSMMPVGEIDVVANYTAFNTLRQELATATAR
jgi:UDP-N-acetylmuramyl tripeptide synthase